MGAKKKNMANKLARMTDEERARYLQQRADIEEEARRRKEQLIVTFMKNKLKKEDAFSRLNLAKINQYWHQILRKSKCKEMKETVEHLKKWMERTVDLKNRTIDNLMQELDEAEEQYCTNLQAHLEYIDNIIEYHMENIDKLNRSYEDERDYLIEITELEKEEFTEKAVKDVEYLKTVEYGQNTEAKAVIKEEYEEHMTKKEEIICEYKADLQDMAKDRDKISAAIWRQIAAIVRAYVEHTDKRRTHLAELERIDADSAVEFHINQARIKREEERIERAKLELTTLRINRTERIKELEGQIKYITKQLFINRNFLNKKISRDEKDLLVMTDKTNKILKKLEGFVDKGNQILFLMQFCRKLETEEEKYTKLMTIDGFSDDEEGSPRDASPKDGREDDEVDGGSKDGDSNSSKDEEDEERIKTLLRETILEEDQLEQYLTEYFDDQEEDFSSEGRSSAVDGVAKISAMLKKTVVEVMEGERRGKMRKGATRPGKIRSGPMKSDMIKTEMMRKSVRKSASFQDEILRKSSKKDSKLWPVSSKHKLLPRMASLPLIPKQLSLDETPGGKKVDVLFERSKSSKGLLQSTNVPITKEPVLEVRSLGARPKTAFPSKLKALTFGEKKEFPQEIISTTLDSSFDSTPFETTRFGSAPLRASTSKSSGKDKTIKQITISNSNFSIRKTKSAISTRNFEQPARKRKPKAFLEEPKEEILGEDVCDEAQFMKVTFESLQDLDGLWHVYNKVYLDLKEMKEERRALAAENKSLRGMIRSILESAALDKTATNSRISTRVGSRYRGIVSAPVGSRVTQPAA